MAILSSTERRTAQCKGRSIARAFCSDLSLEQCDEWADYGDFVSDPPVGKWTAWEHLPGGSEESDERVHTWIAVACAAHAAAWKAEIAARKNKVRRLLKAARREQRAIERTLRVLRTIKLPKIRRFADQFGEVGSEDPSVVWAWEAIRLLESLRAPAAPR